MTCRIYSLHKMKDFGAVTLSGHKAAIIGAFFSADQHTVSYD
jgi:hypothetical protein